MLSKPYSESCERNRDPIFQIIEARLKNAKNLLEIGSGTGQHAVYFSRLMAHLNWQTSDRASNHPAILQWLEDANLDNLLPPLALDVLSDHWPKPQYDAVFSANTAHIMSWQAVQAMFAGVAQVLVPQGQFMLYGPFNYDGMFTSDSNQKFDRWLKSQDSEQGIRDFQALDLLAKKGNMRLAEDITMPANNRILIWRKL